MVQNLKWDPNDFGNGDGITKPQAQAAIASWWSKPAVKMAAAVAIVAVALVVFL